jgi:hypothetical protein
VIIVKDAALRSALSQVYRKSWYESYAPLFTAPGEQPQPDYYADHLHLVPLQLMVPVSVAGITRLDWLN